MREAEAFSPCHITGIFEIHDRSRDPLRRGSRGAGFSIQLGVLTRVRVEASSKPRVSIKINGVPSEARTSARVAHLLLDLAGKPYRVEVEHAIEVPVGAGFGTSGAGALSLALALNEALALDLSPLQAAQLAHLAEIECKTGLGTVVAEMVGGFEIRTKAGGPGIGRIRALPIGGDIRVVCMSLGPMSTKKVLSDRRARIAINRACKPLLQQLVRSPSLERFLEVSRSFTTASNLATPRLARILAELDSRAIPSSMAMLGESVFALVEPEDLRRTLSLFKTLAPGASIFATGIEPAGARLL